MISAVALGVLTLFSSWYLYSKWSKKNTKVQEKSSEDSAYFIAFDKGDYNTLLKISKGYKNAKILVMGTAALEPKLENVITLKDLGIKTKVDASWSREKELDPKEIGKIVEVMTKTDAVAKRLIMFIGVASVIQKQIAEEAKIRFDDKLDLNAVWDNFNVDLESPYGKNAFEVQKNIPRVFVPNFTVAKALDPDQNKTVVSGSPAFDDLKSKVEKIKKQLNDSDFEEGLLKKFGLSHRKTVFVYFGGADPSYYEDSEKGDSALTYLRKCLQLPRLEGIDPQFIILPHPKVKDKKYEEKQFNKAKTTYKVNVNYHMTNEEAIALADCVFTFNSSLGDFARYMGKPVMFIVPPQVSFHNNLVSTGYAMKASNEEEFTQGLTKINLSDEDSNLSKDISDQIVSDSLNIIYKHVPPEIVIK